MQLLNSPALLSYTTPTADPDYDDSTLEDMLHQAHRAQVDHSVRVDLSVSLSSSSMSDRTGQPVGDRSGEPGEHRSSEAQICKICSSEDSSDATHGRCWCPTINLFNRSRCSLVGITSGVSLNCDLVAEASMVEKTTAAESLPSGSVGCCCPPVVVVVPSEPVPRNLETG